MKRFILLAMGILSFMGLQAQNFQSVSAADFAGLINNPEVFRLDVRTQQEFDAGHIDGAICIDVLATDFMQKAEKLLPKDRTIALYCRSGRRSKKAADMLSSKGYKVVELNTGWLGWQAQQVK